MTTTAPFFPSPASPSSRYSFCPAGDTRRRRLLTGSNISLRPSQPHRGLKLHGSSSTLTAVVSLSPISCNAGEVPFAGHAEVPDAVPFQEYPVFKDSVLHAAMLGKSYAARAQNLPLLAGKFEGITQIRVIGWSSTVQNFVYLSAYATLEPKTTKDSLIYVGPGISVKDTDGRATGVLAIGRRVEVAEDGTGANFG